MHLRTWAVCFQKPPSESALFNAVYKALVLGFEFVREGNHRERRLFWIRGVGQREDRAIRKADGELMGLAVYVFVGNGKFKPDLRNGQVQNCLNIRPFHIADHLQDFLLIYQDM